ncbi:MAG: hypothetical protein IKX62_00670 [Bacteroidales bacterium]|nr:hypothetical protein [Bacteroidales bacterium]
MHRYWEAETSPEEERDLARYAARTDDPEFEELRGALGYLSIGRQEKARRSRAIRFYAFAVAAGIAVIAVLGVSLSVAGHRVPEEDCIRFAYGEKEDDKELIMASVEASLTDFFGQEISVETSLIEMFTR